jgi:hypothetical protein
MTAKSLPALATADEIIDALDAINDRAELVAFLAPLRVPNNADDFERARLTGAVVAGASRCWKGRVSG